MRQHNIQGNNAPEDGLAFGRRDTVCLLTSLLLPEWCLDATDVSHRAGALHLSQVLRILNAFQTWRWYKTSNEAQRTSDNCDTKMSLQLLSSPAFEPRLLAAIGGAVRLTIIV